MKLKAENRIIREKNLSQCHFVHHISYIDRPGIEPGPPRYRPATNRLSHGTAQSITLMKVAYFPICITTHHLSRLKQAVILWQVAI
jgi:hypothetical protein